MLSSELARLIAVYSYNSGVKSINGEGGLAAAVGLPPLAIINALHFGEKNGVFSVKRNKGGFDKVLVSDEQFASLIISKYSFGTQFIELVNSFEELVLNLNSHEQDVVRDQLLLWTGGVSTAVFDTAIHTLTNSGEYVTYDITDKNDKKSTYTFITHAENADKRWGLKQLGGK